MNDIRVEFKEQRAEVFCCNEKIGIVSFKRNPVHNQNLYLDLQFEYYDLEIAKCVFKELRKHSKTSLQIMLPSTAQEVIMFIKSAGVVCKRKCYEVEADACNYIGRTVEYPLGYAKVGQAIYEQCCDRMLERYILTHKDINPWTGSRDDFYKLLPKTVYYDTYNGKIRNLAFVENNEIAYVCGVDIDGFGIFAEGLLTDLFGKFESVAFEADDCDEYAMRLKAFFVNQPDESYDTYVL